jgi:fumarate hydratase class II
MAQSSNDSFPSAMYIAAAVNVKQRLIPAVKALHDAITAKVEQWKDVKYRFNYSYLLVN